ncbi:MAG: hypothetical protein JWO58_2026 [Chitinophagaceae bacterium]|nr:hypothetical protein [Chitinophagaceae bacterium]
MKNIYTLLILVALQVVVLKGHAQCKTDECVAKISSGYTFLKTYQMSQVGDQLEYSYVLSKDTNYMLVMCNGGGAQNNIIVTLYDSKRKEIATNQDKASGKVFPAIAYRCNATGIYYLRFSFIDKPECCVSVLAFKR